MIFNVPSSLNCSVVLSCRVPCRECAKALGHHSRDPASNPLPEAPAEKSLICTWLIFLLHALLNEDKQPQGAPASPQLQCWCPGAGARAGLAVLPRAPGICSRRS